MKQKRLTATARARDNQITQAVELNGVGVSEKLTPKMARRAARIAFGHESQVTVWDHEHRYGYRLYRNSARKLTQG